MHEQSLIILKPDTIARGLIGEVITKLEKTGLQLVACKMSYLTEETLKEHYSHLADKPFFPDIVSYMQAAPVLLQVWSGAEAPALIRKIVGATDPAEAKPGTIRGDYSLTIARNIIHASEDSAAAQEEIDRFFSADEIYSYQRCDNNMLYELDR